MISTQLLLIEDKKLREKNFLLLNQITSLVRQGDYDLVKTTNENFMKTNFQWTDSMFDKIYYNRNPGIANSVIKLLDSGSTFIAIVGATHLSGEKGIINLLRIKGVSVTKK